MKALTPLIGAVLLVMISLILASMMMNWSLIFSTESTEEIETETEHGLRCQHAELFINNVTYDCSKTIECDIEIAHCNETADDCGVHSTQGDCDISGCTWTNQFCDGTAYDCDYYQTEPECNYDDGCTWSSGSNEYNDTIMALNPDYRWYLSGDELDSVGSLNSNGGADPVWVDNIIPNNHTPQCGDYIPNDETNLPDAADINTANTYQKSISLWFEADTIDTSGNGRIIWEEGGGTNWLDIYVYDDSGTDKLFFSVGEGGSGGSIDYVSTAINTGQVYHVVAIMDCNAGKLELYVNGSLVDSKTGGLNIGPYLASHGSDPSIGGADGNPRSHTGARVSGAFDGRIADVVYYAEQTVLSATNVSDIYNAGITTGGSGSCSGTPDSCSSYSSQTDCTRVDCDWHPNNCSGTPAICTSHNYNETNCTIAGCTWNPEEQVNCTGDVETISTSIENKGSISITIDEMFITNATDIFNITLDETSITPGNTTTIIGSTEVSFNNTIEEITIESSNCPKTAVDIFPGIDVFYTNC